MSNYTKSTNFATKDNLTPGDPLKIVRGTEIDTEYNNIATAIATKTDNASAAITGGTINATTIGATTASTGAFSTLSATGAITSTLATGTAPLVIASTTKVANLNVDSLDGADWASPAALGSTTPAAVSATTLTTSSTVTFNGGTANGVAYLNGSNVVTSGSALTFDGTNLGIGTSSPSYKLSLARTGNGVVLSATNGSDADFQVSVSSGVTLLSPTTSILAFGTSSTEQMRLTSTGLGIGTSSPAAKLQVKTQTNGNAAFQNSTSVAGGVKINCFNDAGNASAPFEIDGSTLQFNIASTERMRLDASGNLLIGTTTATGANLDVYESGSGDATIRVGNAQNGFTNSFGKQGGTAYGANAIGDGFVYSDSSLSLMADNGTGIIKFSAGGNTERARIDSSGNLLVGTTTTGSYFDGKVTSYSANTYPVFAGKQGESAASVMIQWNAGTTGDNIFTYFVTETSPTVRGSISYNRAGGLTAYNTTSDYRAKDISGPVTDSGSLIDSVPVYMGKMKDATQERPMFIAHEVPAYAHTGEKDAVDADGKPVYQQMDASALIPVMWAEIQSLRKRLADAGI
jgi:hypothetical protein